MIISASRRTDIPKFFSEWFMRRVKEGFFYSKNPFNPSDVKRVSLLPEDVDAVVFWSKDPAPLLEHLGELDSMGYRYYFQFTLNDYPRTFEPNVPPLKDRMTTFRRLADRIGPSRVIWRYDPIILSVLTPLDYHIGRIAGIAKSLEGFTERLVISFLDLYARVRRRMAISGEFSGLGILDISQFGGKETLLDFGAQVSQIAAVHDMDVSTCSEPVDLSSVGIQPGACVDGALIGRLLAKSGKLPSSMAFFGKDPGQRPECLCVRSVDMGAYNTCRHGCVYCYANYSPSAVEKNLARHRLDGPWLIG